MAKNLNSEVLVLNRLWQAVNVVDARRALTLLYVGRGRVVSEDFSTYSWDGWTNASAHTDAIDELVHSPNLQIRVPRVIQVHEFGRIPRPGVRFTRANVYRRDSHRCQYCGRHGSTARLNLDHVLPRSRGGHTTWRNIVVACVQCNSQKRDRRPDEAGMRLMREPDQPRWQPLRALISATPYPEWRPFLVWLAEN